MILGGLKDYHGLKNEARVAAGLAPLAEDTHEVCKHMRAASPPASAADLIEQQMPNRRNTRARRVRRQSSLARWKLWSDSCGVVVIVQEPVPPAGVTVSRAELVFVPPLRRDSALIYWLNVACR